MKINRLAVWMTATLSLLLFGCGGGGGGGGPVAPPSPPPGTQEPPPPSVNYTGNRQAAVLNKSNAAYFASQSIALRAISIFIESLWLDLPAARGTISETVNGSQGGSASVTGNVNQFDVGYLEVEFQSFRENGVTADGRYIQRYRTRPSSSMGGRIFSEAGNGSLEFDDLQIVVTGGSFTLRGVMSISGSLAERFDIDLLVTDDNSGQEIYFENSAIDFTDVTISSRSTAGSNLSGTIYDSQLGSVQLQTDVPFPDLLLLESASTIFSHRGGKLTLTSNDVSVNLWAISRRFTGLMIDLDNDQVADEGRLVSWRELSEVPEVLPAVTTGPIANAGAHLSGFTGEPITVHGLYSHDSDGDWLTYEWRVVFKPFDSPLTIVNPNAPHFSFVTDVDGDYLFALRVSDGIEVRETIVSVLVRESSVPRPVETAWGALEIAEPFQVGAPVFVDGTSATNDPYVGNPPIWFAEGDGNTVLTDTGDLFTRELTVDEEGTYDVSMRDGSGVGSIDSARSDLTFSIGDPFYEWAVGIGAEFDGREVIVRDYNDDGMDDLIVRTASFGGGIGFTLFTATGPDSWQRSDLVPAGGGELATGDLNGDGRMDIATSDIDGAQYSLQAPDGTFPPSTLLDLGTGGNCVGQYRAGDVAIGDIDGNGRDDLILAHYCGRELVSWSQDINGALESPVVQPLGGAVYWGAFDDVNADGRIDALLGFYDGAVAGALYATGDVSGGFQSQNLFPTTGIGGAIPSTAIADTNGDDRMDLIMMATDGMTIFEQQVDGSMVPTGLDTSITNINSAYVTVADVDDDGDADMLLCKTRDLQIGLRQPNGTYQYSEMGKCYWSDSKQNVGAVLDVTGDGVSDLILPGEPYTFGLNPRETLLQILLRNIKTYSRTVN